MLMLNTLGSIGQFEGARIKARTHDPFKRRWVLTGRGWPAAKRVGFKRDAGQWHVVDALQWPHIKFAHMELANSGKNGGTSTRNLRDVLEERGFGREASGLSGTLRISSGSPSGDASTAQLDTPLVELGWDAAAAHYRQDRRPPVDRRDRPVLYLCIRPMRPLRAAPDGA